MFANIITLLLGMCAFVAAIAESSTATPMPIAASVQAANSACSPDGLWNCMKLSFQRCVGGQWSAAIMMAPGTQCYPAGIDSFMNIGFATSTSVASVSASASTAVSCSANSSTLATASYVSATTTAETASATSSSHENSAASRRLSGVWLALLLGAALGMFGL